MNDFDREIKCDFLVEAKELLGNTEQCFLNLEKNCNEEVIDNLFRLAHNLKGSSGAVGFSDLAEFTHRLESLLLEIKQGSVPITTSVVDLLLRCNDYLVATIDLLEEDLEASYRNEVLAEELVRFLDPSYAGTEEGQVKDESNDEANDNETNNNEKAEYSLQTSNEEAPKRTKDENIRVSLSRIDQLLNNIGELVILQTVTKQQAQDHSTLVPQLMLTSLSAMSKIIKETQEVAMGLRMLPIKQTFQKMHRIVRDTSKAVDKQVNLTIEGEETEIDKTVLEQIGDPLVHIIRNAVDHGLEDKEGRTLLAKNPVGQVRLSAYHQAGCVVIEIKDDGKGLDPEKLILKAKQKNLINQEAKLSDEEAYQLIFKPGFSTKEEVTDVSGRGVGMDVVKTNIARLQGEVGIESHIGQGTAFRITLPLTLAIIDSVVVRLQDERYVIPLNQISEFFKPKTDDVNFVHEKEELLTLREEVLPAYRLSRLLNKNVVSHPKASDLTALIARESHKTFAILVDEIVAQQQVVVKPLGKELQGKPGIMGSSILGDGRPAIILDLFELTKQIRNKDSQSKLKSTNREMEVA